MKLPPLSLLILVLTLCACTTGRDPVPDGGQPQPDQGGQVQPVTLTIATFNVRNFFDAQDDPSHKDDVYSSNKVQAKIYELGTALRALDADILALQEVENYKLLQRLNTDELGSLKYKELRLVEGNDIRGIDVALLSRYPTTRLFTHAGDTFQGVDGDTKTYGFSRDCLEVSFEPTKGRTLTLLINHLRSDTSGDGLARRLAQAQRVREITDGLFKIWPSALLAVVGDLNDSPGSKTLRLARLSETGQPPLTDLLTLVPAGERYTTTYTSKLQLDYILASPALKDDLVTGSIKADHRSFFSTTSDHYPVIAKFRID
jgi:endonuclease/exonuclease/phosphatase family metal-dependent hydrolase